MGRVHLHYLITVICAIILIGNIPTASTIVLFLAWLSSIFAIILWLAYKYIPDELNELLASAKAKRTKPILDTTNSLILSAITVFALVVSGAFITAIAYAIATYFAVTHFRFWIENGTTETGE